MVDRMRASAIVLAVIAFAGVAALSTACRREPTASAQAAPQTQVATRAVTVPVDGMICQVCAGGVKSALKDIPGVRDVEVSLEKRNAVVHYEDGKVRVDQLTRAITNLGLKAGLPTAVQQ